MENEIPQDLIDGEYLSSYQAVLFDSSCNEPVAWGYRILKHLGEEKWAQLHKYGTTKCLGYSSGLWGRSLYGDGHADWILIVKHLTRQDAIDIYGKVTNAGIDEYKQKYTIFGSTKFVNEIVQIPTPEEQKIIDAEKYKQDLKQSTKYKKEHDAKPIFDICLKCEKGRKWVEEHNKWIKESPNMTQEIKDLNYEVYGKKCGEYRKGASNTCPLYAYDREIIKKEKNKRDVENRKKRKAEPKSKKILKLFELNSKNINSEIKIWNDNTFVRGKIVELKEDKNGVKVICEVKHMAELDFTNMNNWDEFKDKYTKTFNEIPLKR